MRVVVVTLALVTMSACAAAWYLQQPMRLDEYASARVRIYHTGMHFFIEVTAATETIHTVPTRCVTLLLGARP